MSFRGRRALVTGGFGFLGSHVASALLDEGAHVTVFDALTAGQGGHRSHLPSPETTAKLEVIEADLRDEVAVADAVQGMDFIFHLAGASGHRRSMITPSEDLGSNVVATACLLAAWSSRAPDARVVLASTRQIYGRAQGLLDETHPLTPLDVNGVAKQACEQLLRVYDRDGTRGTSLRLTNAYGPRMMLDTERGHVLGVFIRRALLGEALEVFLPGTDRRSFLHAHDAAQAFLAAARSDACAGRCLNVAGSPSCSVKELADTIGRIANVEVCRVDFPGELRGIDVGDHPLDDAAFRSATGWRPRWGLEDGLRATLEALALEPFALRALG